MKGIEVKTPDNFEELVDCLLKADNYTKLINGGTDVIINLKTKNIYKGTLIDLSGIKKLKEIKEFDNYISIGAGATLTTICENLAVRENFPALVQAAGQVGSTQIRNRATLAGNIGNSSPCADTVVPLMALDARLKMLKGNGDTYEIIVDEAIKGLGKNNLKPNEAIVEIIIPKLSDTYRSAFYKIGSRKAVTISKLNGALVVNMDYSNNIIKNVNAFLGSLGPKAFKSHMVEKALIGRTPSKKLLDDFEDALTKQVDEAIPDRSSRLYKRQAIKGMAVKLFIDLFGQSGIRGGVKDEREL